MRFYKNYIRIKQGTKILANKKLTLSISSALIRTNSFLLWEPATSLPPVFITSTKQKFQKKNYINTKNPTAILNLSECWSTAENFNSLVHKEQKKQEEGEEGGGGKKPLNSCNALPSEKLKEVSKNNYSVKYSSLKFNAHKTGEVLASKL